jgi:hypothetical protein
MRQTVGFPVGSIGGQREDCARSDEVGRGLVLVQFCEDRRECSSCERAGPLALIYTTKRVSVVKRDI